ncbi:unnamed protein product [Phytophthora lilii]|uniref:Unnamed protein product n=1 Tax=Phytophthora lilii TaxID=2077276 RepID=A0A9W6XES8_9STRA|nr:unnamed protein product [Phytophthora lilii]
MTRVEAAEAKAERALNRLKEATDRANTAEAKAELAFRDRLKEATDRANTAEAKAEKATDRATAAEARAERAFERLAEYAKYTYDRACDIQQKTIQPLADAAMNLKMIPKNHRAAPKGWRAHRTLTKDSVIFDFAEGTCRATESSPRLDTIRDRACKPLTSFKLLQDRNFLQRDASLMLRSIARRIKMCSRPRYPAPTNDVESPFDRVFHAGHCLLDW